MKFRYLFVLLGILSLGLFTSGVQADGDVAVCDEAHLLSALSGGGLVTFSCSGTITLSSSLSIDEDTVVDASGQDVTISSGGSFQVLYTNATITLRNLTIENGYGGPYTSGAGIGNTGNLTLDGITVANNAAGSGGGIDNTGQITITNSTIRDNLAFSNSTGVGGNGGGIFNRANGDIFINSSTFYSNDANTGGGIYNLLGTIDIVNSTFYENSSIPGDGGAIFNNDDGTINVTNSTFSRNEAGENSDGSGIDNSGSGSVTITNSIVANSQEGDNCQGTITDGGGNLSYPDSSCPGINLDPVLGPLQDNGGPTLTTALLNGSSAIDNGIDSVCNAPPVNGLDQRGVARPIGEQCDIGAYESDATPPVPDFVLNLDPYYAAMCLTGSTMYDLDVLSVAGFISPVDLSVNNLPAGFDATFENNPVIPTNSSDLTISDTGTGSTGAYTIDIVGTAITRTHFVTAYLYVYDTVPNVQPTLLAPADGATGTVLRPTFSWETIPGAIYYDIEVATDDQFNNIVFSRQILNTSVQPWNNLQENTEYFWRVKASNNCGEGPFSAVYSFTTMGSNPTPTFTIEASPPNMTVCAPEDAVFDVTVLPIAGFNDPVTLSTNGLPTGMPANFEVNPALPFESNTLTIGTSSVVNETDYSVEIVGTYSNTTQSTFVSLHIDAPAPDSAPSLIFPTDGMTDTEQMPTLSWDAVTNATSYKLQVATDSGFNNVVISTNVGQTSYSVPIPLDGNTTYYWRVIPNNICGDGPVSAVFSFTTTGDGAPPTATNFVFIPFVMKTN